MKFRGLGGEGGGERWEEEEWREGMEGVAFLGGGRGKGVGVGGWVGVLVFGVCVVRCLMCTHETKHTEMTKIYPVFCVIEQNLSVKMKIATCHTPLVQNL